VKIQYFTFLLDTSFGSELILVSWQSPFQPDSGAAITFCQARHYLPSQRASMPLGLYQSILLVLEALRLFCLMQQSFYRFCQGGLILSS